MSLILFISECTFIILDKTLPADPELSTRGGGMAGDVNLFFNDNEDEHAAELEGDYVYHIIFLAIYTTFNVFSNLCCVSYNGFSNDCESSCAGSWMRHRGSAFDDGVWPITFAGCVFQFRDAWRFSISGCMEGNAISTVML